MERRGRDGAQYMPVSVEEDSSDATARAWLVMRTEEASHRFYSAQTSWLASAQLSRRLKLSVFTPATRSNCWVG